MRLKKLVATAVGIGIMLPSAAFAQTSSTNSVSALLEQIKALTAQIAALKQQQSTLHTQVKAVREDARAAVKELRGQIACGASGEDVALLQTILASDPNIFPEGIINGVFGKKTSEAVKRFQKLTGLTPTGCVGPQTLNALNKFLKDNPIIVQDGQVCALVQSGKSKPKGWERKLDREREKQGMSPIPTCAGGIPQSILNAFGVSSTTVFVPPAKGHDQDGIGSGELTPGFGKITLCHKPGKDNVTIHVSAAAFQAHYKHGDKVGACSGSGTGTTTPPVADTTPPVISSVAAGSLTTSGATITWTTNENATSQVEYGTTTSYGMTSSLFASLVASHNVSLTGLQSGTMYHFRVISKDAANNTQTSGDMTFTTTALDTTAPVISGVSLSSVSSTTHTVAWTTNESASSKVYYGTSPSLNLGTALNVGTGALVTAHSINLTGLTASTTYYYVIESKDAANNGVTTSEASFTTAN